MGQLAAHLASIDHHVDGALIEQELGPLKALGQFFTYGLLDDPWTGKTDQRLGLGNDHVTHEGEAGRYTTHGGVGKNADKG